MIFIRNAFLCLLMGVLSACALGNPTDATETVMPSITPINTQVPTQVTSTAMSATATHTATARPTNTPITQSTSVGCVYDLTYVVDISLPDGITVVAGSTVTKTWRIENTGTCGWTTAFTFQQIGGDAITASTIPGMFLAVGQTIDISMLLTIGTDVNSYDDLERANFRMFTPNGVPFGDTLYAEIDIILADSANNECEHDMTVVSAPPTGAMNISDTVTATWTLQNTGNCAWQGFTIERLGSSSQLIAPNLPITLPTVDIGTTYTFSTQFSFPDGFNGFGLFLNMLLLRDDTQAGIGDIFIYETVANNSQGNCEWDSDFVTDVTIPDGTVVTAGSTITKTWRLENSGTCDWNSFLLVMTSDGEAIDWAGEFTAVVISYVAVGDTIDLSAELTIADDIPDGETVRAQFQIRGVNNELFGTMPYVEVEVSNP